MKKILLFLVFLFAFSSVVSAQYGKESGIWDFKNEVHSSVFLIHDPDTGGYGTGFVIKVEKEKEIEDGYYAYGLTAAHVCGESGKCNLVVIYSDGRLVNNVSVVSSNIATDLAIIKIWVPKGIEALPIASEPVKKDDEVEIIAYGYPDVKKLEQRRFCAKVDGPQFLDAFFINHSVVPGDSGGLVMNTKGEVVGVIQAGIVRYQWDAKNADRITVWPAKSGTLNCIKDIAKHLFE